MRCIRQMISEVSRPRKSMSSVSILLGGSGQGEQAPPGVRAVNASTHTKLTARVPNGTGLLFDAESAGV
jgi:hypothetical protein